MWLGFAVLLCCVDACKMFQCPTLCVVSGARLLSVVLLVVCIYYVIYFYADTTVKKTEKPPARALERPASKPFDVFRWLENDGKAFLCSIGVLLPHLDRLVSLTRHQARASDVE